MPSGVVISNGEEGVFEEELGIGRVISNIGV